MKVSGDPQPDSGRRTSHSPLGPPVQRIGRVGRRRKGWPERDRNRCQDQLTVDKCVSLMIAEMLPHFFVLQQHDNFLKLSCCCKTKKCGNISAIINDTHLSTVNWSWHRFLSRSGQPFLRRPTRPIRCTGGPNGLWEVLRPESGCGS